VETIIALIKIVGVLLLIGMNAIFVAAEFAFVKVRPTRIYQLIAEGNKKAISVRECIENIDAYLSVSQLGITLASLGLGWLGEPAVAALIHPLLFKLGLASPALLNSISFVIAFSFITFLHVVFGELAPKTLSIQKAESISLKLARPMKFFYRLFYPAVTVLNSMSNRVVMWMGLEPNTEGALSHSQEELSMVITDSYKDGQIKESEKELLQNVFRFERLVTSDVMVPHPEVISLDTSLNLEENIKRAREGGHTRFPLCAGNPDEVIGVVNIKDLIYRGGEVESIESIKREAMFVPESMPLDRLLAAFQKNHQHLALVLDEYGDIAGIITLENVLEELVGEIQDEFDNETPDMQLEEDGSLLVSGRMIIEDVVEKLGLDMTDNKEYNTLAGLVLEILGKKPREGDIVNLGNTRIEVAKMKGMRIDRIRIHPDKEATKDH